MNTIWADFNARLEDDRVRLDTVGSKASLAKIEIVPGMLVWVSDGEVCAKALIEQTPNGLVANVLWDTVEDVI